MACDVDPVEPPEGVPVFKKVVGVSEGGGDGEGAIGDPTLSFASKMLVNT